MSQALGHIGRKTITFVNHVLTLFAFTYRLISLSFNRSEEGRALVRRAILEQVYFTAVQALPVIIPFALIIGSMLIFQFAKVAGQYDLGKTAVLIIVREIGPFTTAVLVILRSATAVTVEISYMNVLNETEAIELAGIDPMRIICLPRLVGITSAILCLFIVFDVVSIMGGYAIVWMVTDISMGNFLTQIAKAITGSDIAVGIVKAVFFGITITATCLYHGFETKKQVTMIPVKTSKASVECFFFCLVLNVGISILFYV
jgi:phospholipid/cholesterol/gamma-HCH transport system permease protein